MASRLIVKGLPGNFTDTQLRQMFSDYGTVTDCALKFTKDGRFRRFAFVGFDNERDAETARRHFDRTFIQATRIQVETCKPFGDETKPRAWSKYAKDSSAYKRAHVSDSDEKHVVKDEKNAPKKANVSVDPKFREFLEVQGKKSTCESAIDAPANSNTESDGAGEEEDVVVQLLRTVSGDTRHSLLFRGLPPSMKAKSLKDWLAPIRLKAMKLAHSTSESAAFVTFNRMPDLRRALQRNDQFIGGFKVAICKVPGSAACPEKDEDDGQDGGGQSRQAEVDRVTGAILETGRLFVRNLPFICTRDDLTMLFKPFGEIAEVELVVDKATGRGKGYAVVTFMFPENAVAAYAALDATIFKGGDLVLIQGRMLHILPGDEKREEKTDTVSIAGSSTFQRQKAAKLKASALGAGQHSWNALFLGPNAIADTLAAQLGTSKADLLDTGGETSAGVRLALGETRLVRETRDFLLAHGVQLDAFSRPAARRSDTVMIAKNLPAAVEADELRRMFEKYGEIGRLLMPKDGISALIEFNHAVDAKKAMQALAYSRFRAQPLYLEWAPGDVFFGNAHADERKPEIASAVDETRDEGERGEIEDKKKLRRSKKHRQSEAEKAEGGKVEIKEENEDDKEVVKQESASPTKAIVDEGEEEEERAESDTTLFVKNLNFDTDEIALRAKFETIGRIKSVTVSRRRDTADPTRALSMGFGFVQFYRQVDAQRALKELQGDLLDGHCLELKQSHREMPSQEGAKKRRAVSHRDQGDCTKILVRNLPFQATRKELRQLFVTFGELRSLRVPKKVGVGENHRGFGFVDYTSRADARRAFEALVHSTHLYGRRLVLEWAKEEESMEELRAKAQERFSSGADRRAIGKQKRRMEAIEKDLTVIDDD